MTEEKHIALAFSFVEFKSIKVIASVKQYVATTNFCVGVAIERTTPASLKRS